MTASLLVETGGTGGTNGGKAFVFQDDGNVICDADTTFNRNACSGTGGFAYQAYNVSQLLL